MGCGGMLFGGDWGAVEHNDLQAHWPAQTGGAALGGSGVVGRGWQEGEGTEGQMSEGVARMGQGRAGGGGRPSEEGEEGTGSRPSADGIERRRRASSRSRSEAAGIWRLGCEAYSTSVHYLRTDGKF